VAEQAVAAASTLPQLELFQAVCYFFSSLEPQLILFANCILYPRAAANLVNTLKPVRQPSNISTKLSAMPIHSFSQNTMKLHLNFDHRWVSGFCLSKTTRD
jgi:hypothetical protein